MKATISLLTLLVISNCTYAQLSGTYSIPTDFATIKKAVDSLNQVGVGTTGITFNVTAGYTENTTAAIIITATGTSDNTITFQTTGGGANPLVTRTDAGTISPSSIGCDGDAVIQLNGTDYITFNGIDVAATDEGIDYGYYTFKPSGTDGCQFVTIQNCVVTLKRGSNPKSIGIHISNSPSSSSAAGVTVTASSGMNADIIIKENTIQNVATGVYVRGSSAYPDSAITIGQSGAGNIIQNYGINTGSANTEYGVYFIYNESPTVEYNTLDNAGGGGSAHFGILYGVYFSAAQGDINVSNNTITFNNVSTSSSTYGIYNGNTVNTEIYNNNTFSGSDDAGSLYLIYSSNGTPNKTISGNNTSGTITSVGGTTYCYYNFGSPTSGTETISNNNFSNLSITGTTSSSQYGINSNTASGQAKVVNGNTISNWSSTSTGTCYAIYSLLSITNTVSNNIVANISHGGTLYGLYLGGTGSVYNNDVYGLSTSTTSTSFVDGIYVSTGTLDIYNNFISDLNAPASTNTTAGAAGIYLAGGTIVNLYYNTIFLKYTSTVASNQSTALYVGSTAPATINMYDNIFVNNVDITVGTRSMAIRKGGTGLINLVGSDNNLYYAGTPSATNVIYYDGTNTDQTLAAYKSRVYPREASSVTENPPFINSTTTPYILHMNANVPTQTDGGGIPVASVTVDYDGDIRNLFTPDIGADEFEVFITDLTPPVISYTPLLNSSLTSERILNVEISDWESGVPTTGIGLPVLYWRINSGIWNAAQATYLFGINYHFSFGGGVAVGDTVKYFVVAQDLWPTPNVGAYPSLGAGGFTYNPPAASIPPTTPSRYVITSTPLSGNYTIGAGGNYPTLTAAMTDLNLRGVSSAVNFLLIEDAYSMNETFPIQIKVNNVSKPTLTNTITIKPNTGVVPFIQGVAASSALVKILESYIVVNGSNSGGTDRSLTIQNTSPDHPSGILFGSIGLTPISGSSVKNCNIINGATYSNPNYGVIISDGEIPGIEGYFNNITIQNNNFQKSFYGIYCVAAISSGNGNGLLITGNNLNSSGTNAIHERGIYLEGVDGAVVSDNLIADLGGNDAGNITAIWFGPGMVNSSIINNTIGPLAEIFGGGTPRGISVSSGVTNSNIVISDNELLSFSTSFGGAMTALYVYGATTGVVIEKNKISDVFNSASFGSGSRGIIINTNVASSDITIRNNFVWNVRCIGKSSPGTWGVGIGVDGATGGVNVYHNSVNIYGTVASDTAGINTAFGVLSTYVSSLDIRNNIFVNKLDNTLGTSDKSYAINSRASSTAFIHIDNNDYYTEGPAGVLGYLGGDRITLASWQTATGQDANSLSGNPDFMGDTDLHINTNSNFVSNNGIYLANVPTDIDGDTRNNPPDPGADEYNTAATTFQLTVNTAQGWNMVSVPGTNPDGMGVTNWWSGHTGTVYKFIPGSGYTGITTTTPTEGYWMKQNGDNIYNTGDEWPAGGIQIVPHDPISAVTGWNMFGGYENSVDPALLTTTPSGQIVNPIYQFVPGSGYAAATSIDPGYGYWIKVYSDCQINVPSPASKLSKKTDNYFKDDLPDQQVNWGKITVTDATGSSYTLYAVKGEVDLNKYELPPLPPAGVFDVRYRSGRIAEDINRTVQGIDLSGVTYPVRVKAEGMDIRLQDVTGKEINTNVKSGEKITISNLSINKLMVAGQLLPDKLSLEQNYPNPFNPTTTIKFSITKEVQVVLDIYDVLGAKVKELKNEVMKPGYYEVNFNATTLASGVYFYRIKAGEFVSTKKMILLK